MSLREREYAFEQPNRAGQHNPGQVAEERRDGWEQPHYYGGDRRDLTGKASALQHSGIL